MWTEVPATRRSGGAEAGRVHEGTSADRVREGTCTEGVPGKVGAVALLAARALRADARPRKRWKGQQRQESEEKKGKKEQEEKEDVAFLREETCGKEAAGSGEKTERLVHDDVDGRALKAAGKKEAAAGPPAARRRVAAYTYDVAESVCQGRSCNEGGSKQPETRLAATTLQKA